MNLPIALHRAAKAEFIEATAWYENRRLGLGVEFIEKVATEGLAPDAQATHAGVPGAPCFFAAPIRACHTRWRTTTEFYGRPAVALQELPRERGAEKKQGHLVR